MADVGPGSGKSLPFVDEELPGVPGFRLYSTERRCSSLLTAEHLLCYLPHWVWEHETKRHDVVVAFRTKTTLAMRPAVFADRGPGSGCLIQGCAAFELG